MSLRNLSTVALLCVACGGNSIAEPGGDVDSGAGAGGYSGSNSMPGPAGSGGGKAEPSDPCADLGVPLWSQHVNKTFDAGTSPAPSHIEHSLRVWFAGEGAFCDELYANDGADLVSVTMTNGQTGSVAIPADKLCTAQGYPAGQLVIEPTTTTFPAPRLPGVVSAVCLRVYRNTVTEQDGRLLGDVDATWQIMGR